MTRRRFPAARRPLAATIAVATLLAVAACGSDGDGKPAAGTPATQGSANTVDLAAIAVDPQAKALLPASMNTGTLKVATELDWPPFSYKTAGGAPTGIDILLIQAVGRKLGLQVTFEDLGATTIIPSVQNGRFDVAVSQLVTTADRLRAVNFVDYIKNTLGLIVREKDAGKISPTELCGHTLVATQGTGPLSFGQQYSKDQCVAKGKPPIDFQVFSDSASTILALGNGRGDGFLSNKAVGVYLAETAQKNLVMDEGVVPDSTTLSGIAYNKQNPELGKAVQAALVSLAADGTYQKILEQWGIADQALPPTEMRNETGP